ncbi:MAG: Spy/CpxP family protein refolding chaperone [Deltaproteobacteria bacterium]|nr:Spy/CpxP family protein refolding chaperone [Deltaproteobacteria bacterium]
MMKNARSFALALVLSAGSLAAIGCGGTVEQPQTQASAASKAPIGQSTHGLVKMVGEALGEVNLRPDQRVELEKLATAAEARHVAMHDGRKELALAVADQVEKGSIDRAALQTKIDRVVADIEKARPEDKQAFARVHAILDNEQRNAFVDALEAKFKHGHHGPHGDKGKHGPKGENAGEEHHAFKGGMGHHGMKQLAEDLKLTDEQKDKIKDVMKAQWQLHAQNGPSFKEMHERMSAGKKSLESFRTEKFDADGIAPPVDKAKAGSGHFLDMAEKILPILTPEQRKTAADKIRDMANKGGELPFGH